MYVALVMFAACMYTSVFISAIFHWNRFSPVIVYLYAHQPFHRESTIIDLYILYSTDEAVLASTGAGIVVASFALG